MNIKVYCLVTVVMFSVFALTAYSQDAVKEEIPTVSVCQLNKTPSKYQGKSIRIIGTYAANFERMTIYDSSCKKVEKSVEFRSTCKTEDDCKQFNKQLYENIKGNPMDGAFVDIVAIGWVEVRNVPKSSNEYNVVVHIVEIEKTSPANIEPK